MHIAAGFMGSNLATSKVSPDLTFLPWVHPRTRWAVKVLGKGVNVGQGAEYPELPRRMRGGLYLRDEGGIAVLDAPDLVKMLTNLCQKDHSLS